MKKTIVLIIFLTLLILVSFYIKYTFYNTNYRTSFLLHQVKTLGNNDELKNGDLIFQTSTSKQSKAIQLATKSRYSHCGIIFINKGTYCVFEAVQPVGWMPLKEWIAKGVNSHYVVKRLKNADTILTDATIKKMKKEGEKFNGKNYDSHFEWSDTKIYCSELIWKIYKRSTGIEIGKLQKLRDFDLSNEIVKNTMKKRYHNKIPMDEIVISPAAIFDSELLITVKSN